MKLTKLFVGAFALSAMLVACGDGSVYGTLTDTRAVKTYKTVKIGAQTWMAENLNYETGNSYCYDNYARNCNKYGRLYTWDAAKKACPEGWHLPSKTEFETLFTAVGVQDGAGTALKSTSSWNEDSGNGTDSFGFSALPAGFRFSNGEYHDEGYDAYFWSSTENDSYRVYYVNLYRDDEYLARSNKLGWLSVRCVKD